MSGRSFVKKAERRLFFHCLGKLFYQKRVDNEGNIVPPKRFFSALNQKVIESGWSPPWVITHEECKTLWGSTESIDGFPANRWAYYVDKDTGIVEFLHRFWAPEIAPSDSILELGPNCGANLRKLDSLGYKNLSGMEIDRAAVDVMAKRFPELARRVTVKVGSLEESLLQTDSRSVDVVFTMGVLMHIHPKGSFIFSEMVRIARRFIVVVELETANCTYIFARNYRRVFQRLGCSQLKSAMITREAFPDVSRSYNGCIARLFAIPQHTRVEPSAVRIVHPENAEPGLGHPGRQRI